MATYLLTWNPSKYSWDGSAKKDELTYFPSLDSLIQSIEIGKPALDRWSSGNTTRIVAGERFFLLRQGVSPRGVVGSGTITSSVFQDRHWSDGTKTSNYVSVQFDALVEAEIDGALPVPWTPQSSGTEISHADAQELEARWTAFLSQAGASFRPLPDEIGNAAGVPEGAKRQVYVNAYERSRAARKRCIAHFGTRCSVCALDFEERYGVVGSGFIHVHHLTPISSIGETYVLNPIRDLRPVCPNCHAMLHVRNPPMAITELQELLR